MVKLLTSAMALAGVVCAQAPPATPASKPAPVRELTGVWMIRNPVAMRAFTGATFTKEPPQLTPWAEAKYKLAKSSNSGEFTLETTNDPVLTSCAPPGVPRVYFHPYPFEFIHTPKYTLMMFEYDHMVRRIYTDGRKLPVDPELSWLGTSIGRWEGNTTFVTETVGLNDKTWLDRLGHPHTTDLKVTERFRRVDNDHMEVDFILADPKALVKPWTSTFYLERRDNWELGEISCAGDYLEFNKFEK